MATDTANTIEVGSITVEFLVEAEDSNASVTAFECTVPAGSKVPAPHSHDGFEETAYGLEGTCLFMIDGQERELRTGRLRLHPPGRGARLRQPRTDRRQVPRRSRHLACFGPAYFHDINEVFAAAAGGPPDLAAIAEVMRRHGLTPAKPAGSQRSEPPPSQSDLPAAMLRPRPRARAILVSCGSGLLRLTCAVVVAAGGLAGCGGSAARRAAAGRAAAMPHAMGSGHDPEHDRWAALRARPQRRQALPLPAGLRRQLGCRHPAARPARADT